MGQNSLNFYPSFGLPVEEFAVENYKNILSFSMIWDSEEPLLSVGDI